MKSKLRYHAGEIAVQERTGERARAIRSSAAVADAIVPGALTFIARQSMVFFGSVTAEGDVWASVMFGERGFATADPRRVSFDLGRAVRQAADPLWSNLAPDAQLGMLFIELGSRRRLRVNGFVLHRGPGELTVAVREAYSNCPKYIQRRHRSAGPARSDAAAPAIVEGRAITSALRTAVKSADTFFVASSHVERGVDVSHRGGPPGFVRLLDDRTLRIPDYTGNGMFNTLGNLALNPNAGLVFLGFESGDVLQMTGRGRLQLDVDDPAGETGGTRRFWDFSVERWLLAERAAPTDWDLLDYSQFLPSPDPARAAPPRYAGQGRRLRSTR